MMSMQEISDAAIKGSPLDKYQESHGQGVPGASMPNDDKKNQIGAAFQGQLGAAKSYLAKMKANSDKAFNSYANQSRNNLAKSIKGTKNDFNSRGLLGSGLQSDRIAGQTSATNTDLNQTRSSINQGLLSNLNQMERGVFDISNTYTQPGIDVAGNELADTQLDVARNIGDSEMNNAAIGQIGGGIGAVGGTGLAELMAGKKKPYNPVSNYVDFNKNSNNGMGVA